MENDCWTLDTHKLIAEFSSSLLWRFVQKNAAESQTEEALLNLTGLKRKELVYLAAIHFLLSQSVRKLIEDVAPKIISRLSKESINEHITDRNRIRGRIDWQQTVKVRSTAGNDLTVFVCTRRSQIYDLPENRLFLFLLLKIRDLSRMFVSADNEFVFMEETAKQKWIVRVSFISMQALKLLKNPFISKISRLHEISDKVINIAEKNRQPHYRVLAEVAAEYRMFNQHPVIYLKEVLGNNILEPLNSDTLYEIAVLFSSLHTAMEAGWKETAAGLIGGPGHTVSVLEKENMVLRIYTQKLPAEMKSNSAYGNIMDSYGLSERLRRPDIILELFDGSNKHFLIIEVKRSARQGYLADGSYKLLGYLKDFEGIRNERTELSGFLVGWDRIQRKDFTPYLAVHMTNWDNFSEGIQKFLDYYENSATLQPS